MHIRTGGERAGAPDGEVCATAELPLRIGRGFVEPAIIRPLSRWMREANLGQVTTADLAEDAAGEPEHLTLRLKLTERDTRSLERIAGALEGLDAPVGSTITFDEDGPEIAFGASHGLGLYLPIYGTNEEDRIGVIEACTDALDGAGLYQGSARTRENLAFYFYGGSFNRMRDAVTFVMTHDPRCRNAYTRRLNDTP